MSIAVPGHRLGTSMFSLQFDPVRSASARSHYMAETGALTEKQIQRAPYADMDGADMGIDHGRLQTRMA